MVNGYKPTNQDKRDFIIKILKYSFVGAIALSLFSKNSQALIFGSRPENTVDSVKIEETIPTHTTKNNASYVLSYTSGNLTTITKTIDGTSYTKTLTYTDGELTSISVWS